MQLSCPKVLCTSEEQAPTSLLLMELETEIRFSLLVWTFTQTSNLIPPSWSSSTTMANECRCVVLAERVQSMSALRQYRL